MIRGVMDDKAEAIKIAKWLVSKKGRKALKKALEKAEKIAAKNHKKRAVSWKQMHEIVD